MPTATDHIADFHEGKISFADLTARLVAHPWRRYVFGAEDRYGVTTPDPEVQYGTWEEVDTARSMGWLTDDQVHRLGEAVAASPAHAAALPTEAKHGDPSRPGYAALHPSGALRDQLRNAAGFTVEPGVATPVTSGYAVSFPEGTKVLAPVNGTDVLGPENRRATVAAIAAYLKRVRRLRRDNEAVRFGAWLDGGKVWLDTSEVLPDTPEGRAEAIRRGVARNQKAIFHLDSMTEIDTGGTGGVE